ncbi:MAG: TolC family protein [Bacteroidales bacterium]|nr:TolC family protein [Bacteroidales bacterium]
MVSFLNLDQQTHVRLQLPGRPESMLISPESALDHARQNNPNFLADKQELMEAEREVERTKKTSSFEANFSASVGFNQAATDFSAAYQNPLQQDVVRVGLTIPIVDWGVRKGRANMATNNLNVTKISVEQRVTTLEQDIIMTVNDFNIQQDLIQSAEEALNLAIMAYQTTKERFIIGKSDLSSLRIID